MSKRRTDLDTSKINPAQPSDLSAKQVTPAENPVDFSNMPNLSLDEPTLPPEEEAIELAAVDEEPLVLEESSSAVLTAELADDVNAHSAVEAMQVPDEDASDSAAEVVDAVLLSDSAVEPQSSDVFVAELLPESAVQPRSSDVFVAELLPDSAVEAY